VVTVCEIKYRDRLISTEVIPEMERKVALLRPPRGHTCERALISLYGPDEALRAAGYFHHYVTLRDILRGDGPDLAASVRRRPGRRSTTLQAPGHCAP